jgi:Tol biopolymer transport system component
MKTLAVVLVLLALPATASATAPGLNGRFAFIALDRHNRQGLFTQFPNGSHLRGLRRGSIDSPAWSADGKRIVFTDGGGIGVVRADGSHLRRFDVPANVSPADPAFAPDGKRVAFTGYEIDPNSDESEIIDTGVYVGRLDGSGFKRVAAGSDPSWAPSGKRIAYVDDGTSSCQGIWLMNPGGSHRTRVTGRTAKQCRVFGDGGRAPDFSPDGKRIVYVRSTKKVGNASERDAEVFVVGRHGRGDHQISHTTSDDAANPVFSPNGRFIAYGSFSSHAAGEGLFVQAASGQGKRHRFRRDIRAVSWQPLR